jgi:hypothetical protein
MNTLQILQQHHDLLEQLRNIIYPWQTFTMALTAQTGVGKSSLARFLWWQLGMPSYSASKPWLVNLSVRLFSVTVRTT